MSGLLTPKTIDYCPHCSFPAEFCEFSNCWDQCSQWLQKKHPELYESLQAKKDADAAAKAAKQAETAAPEDGAAATAEETKPEEPKAEGAEDNSDDEDEDDEIKFVAVPVSKPSSGKKKITIQINARTKRKRTTLIAGLDAFGLNAKELTKPLSKKFATSASVVDDNSVQLNGDLRYDIPDFFLEQYNIPPNSYSIVERGFK